jgi:hypothetical protein
MCRLFVDVGAACALISLVPATIHLRMIYGYFNQPTKSTLNPPKNRPLLPPQAEDSPKLEP